MTADPILEGARSHSLAKTYRRKRIIRICAICGAWGTRPVFRFGLSIAAVKPDGAHTKRGAGGINLCGPCHRAATKGSEKHRRTA